MINGDNILRIKYLWLKVPLLYPDSLHKWQAKRVLRVESCSEQVAEVVQMRCLLNNYEIGSSVTSVSGGGHPWQRVTARAGQGGGGHRQES